MADLHTLLPDGTWVMNTQLTGSNVAVQEVLSAGTAISLAGGASYATARTDAKKYVAVSADLKMSAIPTVAPTLTINQTNEFTNGNDFTTFATTTTPNAPYYYLQKTTRTAGVGVILIVKNNDSGVAYTIDFNVFGWRS